jgi:hypothetical protein
VCSRTFYHRPQGAAGCDFRCLVFSLYVNLLQTGCKKAPFFGLACGALVCASALTSPPSRYNRYTLVLTWPLYLYNHNQHRACCCCSCWCWCVCVCVGVCVCVCVCVCVSKSAPCAIRLWFCVRIPSRTGVRCKMSMLHFRYSLQSSVFSLLFQMPNGQITPRFSLIGLR